jgi:hypothetical protein
MAIDVQEPHEMAALIDTQTRKLRVRLDRDHGFQSIVIINSRAS